MAITEIYVDPSIAADSGNGLIGTPFGDLEYAIEQTTFDTTNGTRVNIKAGTDEVLVADLSNALSDVSVSVAWAPTEQAPCVFQGYTAAAGDGGIGGISGGGSVSIFDGSTFDYVHFADCHLHNCGAIDIIDMDNFCSVVRCEVDNSTGDGILLDASCYVAECYVHNTGDFGIDVTSGVVCNNIVVNGSNTFTTAIRLQSTGSVYRNIISIDGTTDGILSGGDFAFIENNSVYSNAGTGQGIILTTNTKTLGIRNNLVEGFSGAGGIGFDLDAAGTVVVDYRGNSAYDNETEYSAPGLAMIDSGNETLTASPFTDAAANDFSPSDTGSVKEGSRPSNFPTV